MSNWNTYISRFPAHEQPIVHAIVTMLQASLNVTDLRAIAELQPDELVNVISMTMPEAPVLDAQDYSERLAFAERMIVNARAVLAPPKPSPTEVPPIPVPTGKTSRSAATKRPERPKPAPRDTRYVVRGRVLAANLNPLANAVVRAFEKDLRHEEPLGEDTTGDDGRYEIKYEPPAPKAEGLPGVDLLVRVYERTKAGEKETATSPVRFQAGPVESINLITGLDALSEYERIVKMLGSVRDGVAIADFTPADVSFVAADTGLNAERIGWVVAAQKVGAVSSLPPKAFFGYLVARHVPGDAALDRFWKRLGQDEGLEGSEAELFRFAAPVAEIAGYDPPMTAALLALRKSEDLMAPIDLALWRLAEWARFAGSVWDGKRVAIPDWVNGDDRETRLRSAAREFATRAARLFPLPMLERQLVAGRVRTPHGRPAAGVWLQAFHRHPHDAVAISSAVQANDDGDYWIAIDADILKQRLAAAGSLPLQLEVQARPDDGGTEIGRSAAQSNATLPATVHITVNAEVGPSEFEIAKTRIGRLILDRDLLSLPEDRLPGLASATGLDLPTVRGFVAAHRMADLEPGLSPQVIYAISHPGVIGGASAAPSRAADRLKLAVDQALVPASVIAENEAAATWLRKRETEARAIALRAKATPGGSPRHADILKTAGVSDEHVESYSRVVAEHEGADADTLTARLNDAKVPEDVQQTIRRASRIAGIVGGRLAAVSAALEALPAIRPARRGARATTDDEESIRQLARLRPDEWEKRLPRDGRTASERRRDGRAMAAAFEREFRHDALLGHLASRSEHAAALRFLADRGLKLDGKSVNDQDLSGAEPAVKKTLSDLQRLARVASAEQATTLLTLGYASAQGIAAKGRSTIARELVAALMPAGLTGDEAKAEEKRIRAAARAIHNRATRQSNTALALAVGFSPHYHAVSPQAVGTLSSASGTGNDPVKARLTDLFGSTDACMVATSQSVLGLPAYYVDLLHLLEDQGADPNPADVLRGLRPDLFGIQLSTANAETLVPYIDIVIELLERTVAPPLRPRGGQLLPAADRHLVPLLGTDVLATRAGSTVAVADTASPQTTLSAEELLAYPEHLRPAAYTRLQEATFPWPLPFSLAHEEAAVYTSDLGLSRDELMRRLRKRTPAGLASPEDLQTASVALGLNPAARALILGELDAAKPWLYWGHTSNPGGGWPASEFSNTRQFLERAGLEFSDLLELLATDFLNPEITPGNRGVNLTPTDGADACDLSKMRLEPVTAAFMTKFHRFARLWRMSGFTVREIDRAITAFGNGAITAEVLVGLAEARRISVRLSRPLDTVMAWFGDLDTRPSLDRSKTPPARMPSQYDAIFQDRRRVSKLDRERLAVPFAGVTRADALASACAVLGIDALDYERLTAASPEWSIVTPPIAANTTVLEAVSALCRWQALARAVGRPILDLLRLGAASGLDPFANPVAMIRFLDAIELLDRRGISIDDFDFVTRHVTGEDRAARYAEAGLKLFQRVRDAALRPGLTPGRDEISRALESIAGDADEKVARILEVLEGTGISQTPNVGASEGVRLSNGDVLTVQQVRDRLQPLVAAPELTRLTTRLVQKGQPDSSPGSKRTDVLIALDQVAAELVKPALRSELARACRVGEISIDAILGHVVSEDQSAEPIVHTFARLIRENTGLADADAFRLSDQAWAGYVKVAKTAWLFGRLEVPAAELALADSAQAPLMLFDPNQVPAEVTPASSPALFQAIRELSDLADVRLTLASAGTSLSATSEAIKGDASITTDAASWAKALQMAGRNIAAVDVLVSDNMLGITGPAHEAQPSDWKRVLEAVTTLQLVGAGPVAAKAWVADDLDLDTSGEIRTAAAGKRGPDAWAAAGPRLRNTLRERQRAALKALVMVEQEITDADALQNRYLVDVEMGADQLTTRLALAVASVQRFVQRVLLGAETAGKKPVVLNPDLRRAWPWMKSYRTWKDARAVFLYPENFIQPDLRDDKSPIFVEMEQLLAQRDLSDQTVDAAIGGYLQKLDAVARMEVMGTCIEDADGDSVLHIVARTRAVPHEYYHRTWSKARRQFKPWVRLEADVDGDWVVPIVLDGRLNLYWIKHSRQIEGMSEVLGMVPSRPVPLAPHFPMYQDQYTLSWSTRQRNGWSAKQTADRQIARPFNPLEPAHFGVRLEPKRLRIGGVTLFKSPPPHLGSPAAGRRVVPKTQALTIGGSVPATPFTPAVSASVTVNENGVQGSGSVGAAEASGGIDSQGNVTGQTNVPGLFLDAIGLDPDENPFPTLDFAGVIAELIKLKDAVILVQEMLTSAQSWNLKSALEKLKTDVETALGRLAQQVWDKLPPTLVAALTTLQTIGGDLTKLVAQAWDYIDPVGEFPQRLAGDFGKLAMKFVQSIGETIQRLWLEAQDRVRSNGQFIEPARNQAWTGFVKDIMGTRPGWEGPRPGFEFGFFDIGEGGAKALRLAPPLIYSPELATIAGMNVFSTVSVIGGAGLVYSLFPGYPGLFEVPVLNGVLSIDLSLALGSSMTNDLVRAWPGSGYLLGPHPESLALPAYCSLAINLAQIAREESDKIDLTAARNALASGQAIELNHAVEAITDTYNVGGDTVDNLASLLNVGMRVVRPLPFGPFPGRLHAPPPLLVSEDRHGRSYMMVRTDDGKNATWSPVAFYHPLTSVLIRDFLRSGVKAVYESGSRPDGEAWKWGDADTYPETETERRERFLRTFVPISPPRGSTIDTGVQSGERLDLSPGGAYSHYNWELFFHVPMLLGARYAAQQDFERALQWYRNVFDPTVVEGPERQKFWRFKAFYDEYEGNAVPTATISRWLTGLAEGTPDEDREGVVEQWRRDPFNPHLVARLRSGAFQRAAVMRTVDTLINWGDARFRDGKWESINEATQLYLLARDILGPRPRLVPARPADVLTYDELQAAVRQGRHEIDSFGNAVLRIESELTQSETAAADSGGDDGLVVLSGASMLYFGVPPNERLLEYWDTVDDRLFKIRHGLDIRGRARPKFPEGLGLDEAGALVAAAASDEATATAGVKVALPPYRFQVMVQKAIELAGEVRAFGAAVLAAVEKRDAEALARLRSGHEVHMLERVTRVRELQVEEAGHALDAARQGQAGAEIRLEYYESREFLNAAEAVKEALSIVSSGLQLTSGGLELASAVVAAMPNVNAGLGGAVECLEATVTYGATQLSGALSGAARGLSLMASVASTGSSMAGTFAMYQRRQEEWELQATLAENDVEQFAHQIAGAETRRQIVLRELENHRKQMANAREVDVFMREKFTNQELYDWMLDQVSRVHFQSYLLAIDMARRAEACYRFERAPEQTAFIKLEQWDTLGMGLLAGERLQQNLRRMEAAYLERNTREYELTKAVSIGLTNPEALLMLQQKGECYVDLPERVFDADHPGHYLRRLKTVSLSIPCVAGPYTSVNCRLTLVHSRVRIDPAAPDSRAHYQEGSIAGDKRFQSYPASTSAIATSGAQNDSGVFELNLRDERYLPFEGAGAISTWRIELPRETNRFDFASISDVIMHLRYTARDGGPRLRDIAWQATFNTDVAPNPIDKPASFDRSPSAMAGQRVFSARRDFGDAWHRFINPPEAQQDIWLDLDLSASRLPYPPAGRGLSLTSIRLMVVPASSSAGTGSGLKAPIAFVGDGTTAPVAAGGPVEFKVVPTHQLPWASAEFAPPGAGQTGVWRLRIGRAGNTSSATGLLKDGPTAGSVRVDLSKIDDLLVLCSYAIAP